jgi:hypothetical protein
MKLDLLYEFQPAIAPYAAKPHPYGQRDAEVQVYNEAFEQIQLADKLGFETIWCVEHHFREGRSASPTPEAILGGLALTTQNIRRDLDALWLRTSRTGGGKGRDRRHHEQGAGRMGNRTIDPDGTDRLRRSDH